MVFNHKHRMTHILLIGHLEDHTDWQCFLPPVYEDLKTHAWWSAPISILCWGPVHVYRSDIHNSSIQHPPRGAKWMLRGATKRPLRVQTPPLGGCRYVHNISANKTLQYIILYTHILCKYIHMMYLLYPPCSKQWHIDCDISLFCLA